MALSYESRLKPTIIDLTDTQLERLKSILQEPNNFGPSDKLKKCRFEPDIQFLLNEKKSSRNLEAQFCRTCKTWRVFYNSQEYFGNYDSGQTIIDNFIKEFDKKETLKNSYLPERFHAVSLKKLFGDPLFNSITGHTITSVLLSFPKDSIAAQVNENGHHYISEAISLDTEEIKMLYQLLLEADLYDQQRWVRMCDQPTSSIIQITNKLGEVIFIYLSEKCGQVTIKAGNEGRTLSCSKLVRKFNHLKIHLSS